MRTRMCTLWLVNAIGSYIYIYINEILVVHCAHATNYIVRPVGVFHIFMIVSRDLMWARCN